MPAAASPPGASPAGNSWFFPGITLSPARGAPKYTFHGIG